MKGYPGVPFIRTNDQRDKYVNYDFLYLVFIPEFLNKIWYCFSTGALELCFTNITTHYRLFRLIFIIMEGTRNRSVHIVFFNISVGLSRTHFWWRDACILNIQNEAFPFYLKIIFSAPTESRGRVSGITPLCVRPHFIIINCALAIINVRLVQHSCTVENGKCIMRLKLRISAEMIM